MSKHYVVIDGGVASSASDEVVVLDVDVLYETPNRDVADHVMELMNRAHEVEAWDVVERAAQWLYENVRRVTTWT